MRRSSLWFVLPFIACDPAPSDAERDGEIAVEDSEGEEAEAPAMLAASPAEAARVMPDARTAFDKSVKLATESWVGGELTEDEIWTAALEGVLARLSKGSPHAPNVLLGPSEMSEMHANIKGHITGIGVAIEAVADVVVVKEVIPGSPAEAAGIAAGDRILAVDGTRTRGVALGDIVGKIRGAEGTQIELFVQRDTDEWTVKVTRGKIEVPSVDSRVLEGGVGLLRISTFAKTTMTELDAQLEELARAGVKSLVLDLRGSPGGMFDAGVAVAGRFVPVGERIVSTTDRAGTEEHHASTERSRWQSIDIAVLVDKDTSSSAEILAAALQDHGRGTLIGERTIGKGTIEEVHQFDNGWGLKLSVRRFVRPSGESFAGVGVTPDILVPTPEGMKHAMRVRDADPATDPQLATALHVLTMRR
jgi:carboxyl-terminal processing protease